MSTTYKANIYVKNELNGTASMTVSYKYGSNHPVQATGSVAKNETIGPLEIEFGSDSSENYWFCSATVSDGPNPGWYSTQGSADKPTQKCKLTSDDVNRNIQNSIMMGNYHINIKNSKSTCMAKLRVDPLIANVFVVMLENRAFDHIFGFSGIPAIIGLKGDESNTLSYTGGRGNTFSQTYTVTEGAVDPMTTDPGHEFLDTLEQLCGKGATYTAGQAYPHIDNSGFLINYITSDDEGTGFPVMSHITDVMACCSPDQIPVLYQLATEFALCDQWFSSMPGPTWPNRLFAMAASSCGLDDSPPNHQIAGWQFDGISFPNGNIFQSLDGWDIPWRIYTDAHNIFAADPAPGSEGGGFSIVEALHDVYVSTPVHIEDLASDVLGSYPYRFTWIEPNYGDVLGDTYSGGSSQHAMDSLAAGEALVAYVYNSIRAADLWDRSLLIITYDEHGGFYDHVAPFTAKPPGDKPDNDLNQHGFDFSKYGVRVPAVIVSPRIAKGTVDHTTFDHTSALKTIENFYGISSLTQRDGVANSLGHLVSFDTVRTDCPATVGSTTTPAPAPQPAELVAKPDDDVLLPEKGNVHGALYIAAKHDAELSGGDVAHEAVRARLISIKTRGQARQYFHEVMTKVEAARAAKTDS